MFEFKCFLCPMFSSIWFFFLLCFVALVFTFVVVPCPLFLSSWCLQIQFSSKCLDFRNFFLVLNPFFYQQKWQLLLLNINFSFQLKVSRTFTCHINCFLISEILIFMKLQSKGGRWAKLEKLMTNHCSLLYFLIFFSSPHAFFLGNQRFIYGA